MTANAFAPLTKDELVEPLHCWPADNSWQPILPVPDDAPQLARTMIDRFTPEKHAFTTDWRYNDSGGRLLGYVVRFDTPSTGNKSQKEFKPFSFCEGPNGRREWRCRAFPEPRPLYGLDRLAAQPDASVLVTEGEKSADAAMERFPDHVAVTSPGGSGGARKANWSPLAGRHVTIWPDADDAGGKYADDVANMLRKAGAASISLAGLAALADLPGGWDLADNLPPGVTEADLTRVLVEAEAPDIASPLPLFRPMPPPEPFPLDALGDLLAAAARGIHARIQAPETICAQAVLSGASLAVQAHADVELPTGHRKPLSLFCCTIAASGERKSAVDYEALWPVRKRETALREAYAPELESYHNDVTGWSKARDEAVKKAKGDRHAIKCALDALGSAPRAPLLPILTLDEPNWQGLCRAFDEGMPSMGLFSAEGGAFLGGHGMQEENRLRTATGLSLLWDGEPIRRARGGEGVKIMPGLRLSMHLMLQPGVAERLLGDAVLIDQGLTSRMLVAAPVTSAGSRFWREVPTEAEAAIKRYCAHLMSILEMPLPVSPDNPSELAPRALQLSPDARRLWIATADAIEKRLAPGGPLDPVRSFANKGPEHAARIAGVLTMIADPSAKEISPEAMAAGVEILGFYTSEALRLHAGAHISAELRLAQQLLDWLRAWPEPLVSLPDIYQRGPGRIRDSKAARKMVEIIVTHGHLDVNGPGEVAGVRRRETWAIRR